MALTIGVPKQDAGGETRVALTPDGVKRLTARGIRVVVEPGAGVRAFHADEAYASAGAKVERDAATVWGADVVCVVAPVEEGAAAGLKSGGARNGMLRPVERAGVMRSLAERGVTAIAFEAVARITRAQRMDALSAMSTVAGYRAAILAAQRCPKFFPMMMTAAGTITPARVLVVGAGVAGLTAISTARRLGAVVEGYDIRPAAKQEVLSLGARLVELPVAPAQAETAGGYAREQSAEQQRAQAALLADHVAQADVVITTALVPGRRAPRLIDRGTLERMRQGSVVIDLAAEAGGNCEATRADEEVRVGGVLVLGPTNLPAQAPVHASQMYSKVVEAMLEEVAPKGELSLDMGNDVVGPSAVTHAGEVRHAGVRAALGLGEPVGSAVQGEEMGA